MLVVASTEVDKTGASYYGEQTLHYIAANGESAVVQLREYSLAVLPWLRTMTVKKMFNAAKATQSTFLIKGVNPNNITFMGHPQASSTLIESIC